MAFENREFIPLNRLFASDLCLADGWNTVECKTDNRLAHWNAARIAITKLKSQGFFCVQDASDPESPEFLWHLLTFCYAKKIFSAERIVRCLREERWLPVKPAERCLLAHDLRRFRRNNRKILMLSLEEFFKNQLCPEARDKLADKTESIRELAEQCVLSAIRWDAGELDG